SKGKIYRLMRKSRSRIRISRTRRIMSRSSKRSRASIKWRSRKGSKYSLTMIVQGICGIFGIKFRDSIE
ncbi:hypothetical protein L9F63_022606, partial [Diploptera punctata]